MTIKPHGQVVTEITVLLVQTSVSVTFLVAETHYLAPEI